MTRSSLPLAKDSEEDLEVLPGTAGVHISAFLRDRRLDDLGAC